MSFEKNVPQVISYEYDFAVDGGAVGAIDLRAHAVNLLKEGLVIQEAKLHVETALVSGAGSATMGDGTDADGLFVDLVALAAGSYSSLDVAVGGALLLGQATDLVNAKKLLECDGDTKPVLTIGTGALTAGKFKVDFICAQK